jgi:hypothetical protein
MKTTYTLAGVRRAAAYQLLCLVVGAGVAFAQTTKVTWSSFDGGFIQSQSSNARVRAVAGQSFAGVSLQTGTQVITGFLADTSFRTVVLAVHELPVGLPAAYLLEQNYPNPFNPSTTIRYGLPARAHVTLAVYNTIGQRVVMLVDQEQEGGYHEMRFEGNAFASGVYFYRLQSGDFVQTRKLLLLK